MKLTRRKAIAIGVPAALLLAAALAFGPLVRSRVAAEASRRHLELEVGSVRPGWFAVRLLDVHVRPQGVAQVDVHLDEMRVELDGKLAVHEVLLRGGELKLVGSASEISRALKEWRAQAGGAAEHANGHAVRLTGEGLALHWSGGDGDVRAVEASGVGFAREGDGLRARAADAVAELAQGEVAVHGGELQLGAGAVFERFHAAALELTLRASPAVPAHPVEPQAPSDGPHESSVHPRTAKAPNAVVAVAAVPPVDVAEPIVPTPDLHVLRARVRTLATQIAHRLPADAEIVVDAMALKVKRGDTSVEAGPGAFSIAHRPDHFEVRFATEPGASGTPLSVRADLPLDAGDVSVTLEGGPVSLAMLGLKDGTAGLTDIDKGTIAGRGRMVLADEGDALTFDGEVRLHGVGLEQPRIARDPIHDLDLGVSARGALDDKGEIRVDELDASMGALHLDASGVLLQASDRVAATFQVDVPAASCQSLFESLPRALVPTMAGAKYEGTFGAHGRASFDSRKLDAMLLDYAIADDCRVVEVPPLLARERFQKPFQHRIYLPDGTLSEETTGPGSSKWTPLGGISPFMQVAVQTTEDGGFYHHRGFSHPAIKASIIANLKARRFLRGASTITMQLAKNLFLMREKTLSRKFEEMILTDYLEQVFSKQELMELYLNVIEFGPNVYGIKAASYYYFGRSPGELNLAESLFLSSMLPSPLKLSGLRTSGQLNDGWQHTIVRLMEIAHKNGLISNAELEDGKNEVVVFHNTGPRGFAQRRSDPIGDDGTETAEQDPPPPN